MLCGVCACFDVGPCVVLLSHVLYIVMSYVLEELSMQCDMCLRVTSHALDGVGDKDSQSANFIWRSVSRPPTAAGYGSPAEVQPKSRQKSHVHCFKYQEYR